ncbi:hypothetical protein [Burkholderia gladioli]|uniref:hypothetical protein n=1 Tax=Burkholderia gladioli TaxID=28095 RepID=UPI00163DFACD|nr:hypothetical protein [Burkholderia gladioli]
MRFEQSLRFVHGMQCCNPFRENARLTCDYGNQLACAAGAIERMAAGQPHGIPLLLNQLLDTFPMSAGYIFEHAIRFADPDVVIDVAAKYCSTLPTKPERIAFKDQIAGFMSAPQMATFERTTRDAFANRKASTHWG